MNKGLLGNIRTVNAEELIQRIVLSATQPVVTFDQIPQTYRHLVLRFQARVGSGTQDECGLTFNGDSSAVYDTEGIFYGGVTRNFAEVINGTSIDIAAVSGVGSGVGQYASYAAEILGYTSSVFFKYVSSDGWFTSALGGSAQFGIQYGGVWRNVTPVTRIDLTVPNSFVADSVFALYGVH